MHIPGPAFEMTVPAVPSAVATARRALAGRHLVESAQEPTLMLLVSELVTNSVRHAGTTRDDPIRVRARTADACAHVEVCDAGRSGTTPRRRRDGEVPVLEPGGLGLKLVEEMSDRWGVTQHAERTCVWFELACGVPPAPV
jgi:anti-sigma regulatory factor (Ser/Thr protein kinase)